MPNVPGQGQQNHPTLKNTALDASIILQVKTKGQQVLNQTIQMQSVKYTVENFTDQMTQVLQ